VFIGVPGVESSGLARALIGRLRIIGMGSRGSNQDKETDKQDEIKSGEFSRSAQDRFKQKCLQVRYVEEARLK